MPANFFLQKKIFMDAWILESVEENGQMDGLQHLGKHPHWVLELFVTLNDALAFRLRNR